MDPKPETGRERARRLLAERNRSPESRERSRRHMLAFSGDPAVRAQASERAAARNRSPEGRAWRSALSRSPEHLQGLAAARASRSPECLAQIRAALDAWNASPEGKANSAAQLAKVHATWAASEAAEQVGRTRPNLRRHIPALRERDGDGCQLCGEGPIDFGLPWPNPFSVSVDHIEPYRVRRNNALANLQLAHLICNWRKGARETDRPNPCGAPEREVL